MTRKTRFTVRVEINANGGDLPGLLDMLRYEGGTVISWDRADRGAWTAYSVTGYEVTIEVESLRHVPDRWRSFGIYPQEPR